MLESASRALLPSRFHVPLPYRLIEELVIVIVLFILAWFEFSGVV
jgi:hypothetical protein